MTLIPEQDLMSLKLLSQLMELASLLDFWLTEKVTLKDISISEKKKLEKRMWTYSQTLKPLSISEILLSDPELITSLKDSIPALMLNPTWQNIHYGKNSLEKKRRQHTD